MSEFVSLPLALAAEQFAKLPGIGIKTAQRLAYYVLNLPENEVCELADNLVKARKSVRLCSCCQNFTERDVCEICSQPRRNRRLICVVENVQNVLAIENTQQYDGLYHVLGGIISPMDGIGPKDLEIDSLVERVSAGDVDEVIMALSPTMEGDTTCFYLSRRLEGLPIRLTTVARGVSVGDELEYADELTLGRSIVNRVSFHQSSN